MEIPTVRSTFGYSLQVDNVNEALPLGLQLVDTYGIEAESRGIKTIRVPGPVSTIYLTPQRRVLFDVVRNANPFFHLIESLWILSGSNRVALPAMFLSSIRQFSDNGATFHGAYGHRLRHFGEQHELTCSQSAEIDQLYDAVNMLKQKPDTRQCVLSIWDPTMDLGAKTKDIPCNDMIMLDIVGGHLNMTVYNRSNDVIWGAYGANAVQFSFLQEWIAAAVGVGVGYYVQQSNNYHVYPDNPTWAAFKAGTLAAGHVYNEYMNPAAPISFWQIATSPVEAFAVLRDAEAMEAAACAGRSLLGVDYESAYFKDVIWPVIAGYGRYKEGDFNGALLELDRCKASDWRLACHAWVDRRKSAHDGRPA